MPIHPQATTPTSAAVLMLSVLCWSCSEDDSAPGALEGVAIKRDPGPHALAIDAGADGAAKLRIVVASGEQKRVVVLRGAVAPAPQAANSKARPVPLPAWVSAGVGAAGL